MTTLAFNVMGRMEKLALKPLLEQGTDIAWLNDARGVSAMLAYLLEFDTIYGRRSTVSNDFRQRNCDYTDGCLA